MTSAVACASGPPRGGDVCRGTHEWGAGSEGGGDREGRAAQLFFHGVELGRWRRWRQRWRQCSRQCRRQCRRQWRRSQRRQRGLGSAGGFACEGSACRPPARPSTSAAATQARPVRHGVHCHRGPCRQGPTTIWLPPPLPVRSPMPSSSLPLAATRMARTWTVDRGTGQGGRAYGAWKPHQSTP